MAYSMTQYEWTIEAVNKDGDIEDVDHADSKDDALKLAKATKAHSVNVCLVRDSGPRLETRMWAYLKNGVLPATFSDSEGCDTGVKVPKRFR